MQCLNNAANTRDSNSQQEPNQCIALLIRSLSSTFQLAFTDPRIEEASAQSESNYYCNASSLSG